MKNLWYRKSFVGRGLVLACACLLAVAWTNAARGEGDLKSEIERQVGIIKSALAGATDIQLKEFECGSTDELNGHVGTGLRAAFEEALRGDSIKLNERADHVLSGQYFTTSRKLLDQGKPLRLTIKVSLTNRDGDSPVTLLPIDAPLEARHFASVNNTKDLARALGFTGRVAPEETSYKRQEEMVGQVRNPGAVIDGTRMRSSAASEYDVEVRKRMHGGDSPFRPVAPTLVDGVLHATIALNEEYELKIVNRSKTPVAVSVTVDGLDVFYFADQANRGKDGKPRFTHFIVYAPGDLTDGVKSDGTSIVPGWFQTLAPPHNYLSFLVTEHGKGAISRAPTVPRDKVGAIHVQFAHCKPAPENGKPKSGNETGFGMPRSVEQKAVQVEIEPPHEFLTVRYDRVPK